MSVSATIAERASRTTGGFKSGVQWPPRVGYYTTAKTPLNLIYPRPDLETQTHARHRWAHSQMEYQIPIGVQGGAWPFRYEIISAPPWLNIGSYLPETNYGVLHGTPTTTVAELVVVRVWDANNTDYIDASFVLQSDLSNPATVDAKFVFIEAGYVGTKVGTIDQPLATFADWYKDLQADSTYHNQIVVWRGGNYTLTSNAGENNGNPRLQANSKTPSLIGFPGEEPIIDMTNGKILDDDLGTPDLFIAGITFNNYRSNVNNAHHFMINGVTSRSTFWGNKFKNIGAGLVGDDNTAPVFYASTATVKNYVYFADNTFEDVSNATGNNGALIDLYKTSNVLIERNTALNCTTNNGFWLKGTVSFVSLRGNTGVENITGKLFALGYGTEAGDTPPHDHEICYNNFKSSTTVCSFAASDGFAGQTYNTFLYRNTLQGADAVCQYAGSENFKTDANILNLESYANWNESIQTSAVANIKSATAVDAGGKLTGATGFATHGWEVQA